MKNNKPPPYMKNTEYNNTFHKFFKEFWPQISKLPE